MQEITCDLCGSKHQVVVYKSSSKKKAKSQTAYSISQAEVLPPERIIKCISCGLVFVPPGEDTKRLLDEYAQGLVDEEYISEEPGRRKTAAIVLNKLKKYKNGGNCLLDIGCSAGFFLDEAKKRGWSVEGVDPSVWAAEFAQERFGIKVHNMTLKQANLPANFYDVVVLHDTIEHILKPRQTLVEIRRILKPDGVLYINTPDINSIASRLLKARWWGINRYHLFYFSKDTLNRLLEASGFKSIRWGLYVRNFTVRYWLKRIKPYNKTIYNLLKLVSRITRLENNLIQVNFRDQIEVFAGKRRLLRYLSELEESAFLKKQAKMKTIVVLPAYNASRTLKATYDDIPKNMVDEIILVDDASSDNTVEIAKQLGIKVFRHKSNKGYGANQKTCYLKALEAGADIIVMVHPDYQYDPRVIPDLIEPIKKGQADAVFGSRMLKGGTLIGGMPLWKHNVNIVLSALANIILKTYLSEYHSGFRAYSAEFLRTVKFQENSDNFVFDFEIIVQAVANYCKIEEIPIRTRYFDEASTITFGPSIIYGLGILLNLFKYILHSNNIFKFKQLQ